LLADLPELVRTLGLETVPHFTTLHKAARRLLRLPLVHRLLTVTIRRVRGHKWGQVLYLVYFTSG